MYELGIAPFSEHQIERALLRYRTRIDALFRDGDISNTNDMSLASELSLFSKLGDYYNLARRTMEIILPEGHIIPPEE